MPIKDPDLARIRDNQRRSRARRKEYLQEIEIKVRQCENQGVEAASEIQLAARRVVEENRKLRELLLLNRVSHDTIEAHLRGESSQDMDGTSPRSGQNVQHLEQSLQRRKCCSNERLPCTTNEKRTSDAVLHEGSRNASGRMIALSNAGPVDGTGNSNMRTSSASSDNYWVSTPTHSDLSLQPLYGVLDGTTMQVRHIAGPGEGLPYATQNSVPDATLSSDINCEFATDMISTMAGGDPAAVRAELGCVPGGDCEVNHSLVFSIMDRYTGTAY